MGKLKYLIVGLILNLVLGQFEIVEYSFNENNIVTFYINSFDLVTGATDIELFHYGIKATDPTLYELDDLELILEFSMSIKSPSLGYNVPTDIIGGQVRITNIHEEIHFQNTDLNINTTRVGNAVFAVDITDQPDTDKLESIANAILQMGKLPNGTYNVNVSLKRDGVEESTLNREIEMYFPVYLELVNPGSGSLADTSENSIFTTYPVFQWESDYCPICVYSIRVSEYNPVVHSSFSEAISDVSNIPLSQSEEYFDVGNSTTFQFPVSDAIDLETGKLYVWQVRRNFETSLGTNDTFSNIFVFKIQSVEEGAEVLSSISDVLVELIGETQYDQYFGTGGELSGFSLTGNSIILNNESVPISQLNEIVSQLSQGTISITTIEVE